ncbi:hypothetical protein Aca07nite_87440 [Actinoplanes capillaceus]|uniref:Uncharacterized protein n=1 Tax=Actinoplanes campanulatus TaxID=113559 RepID=A0ABQ3WYV2_9ACTN|nr:hypothetical protein [Actinoplanes capillaceus]GID51469.1 hypothetical protein Aca07nite_87440 [Actinoplanes capillaceus]
MSGLTLQDLLGFDAGPWHSAAEFWSRLAQGVDDASEDLIRCTRDLDAAWPQGRGSTTALEKGEKLRAEVDNTYLPAKRLADAFDQHAYAMKGYRTQAEQIVASAQQAGYTVDTATMSITAPASAYQGGNVDRTGRETGALLNDLRLLVDYARAQDDTTAATIKGNVPSAQNGFGTTPPGKITRAQELATKIKDPAYEPTTAELDELRSLVQVYGKDPAFAHGMLTNLGPKGLLELSGTLATLQLDQPGKDADGMLFSRDTAYLVQDLQNGLGMMLSTATAETGTTTGLRGETYVPGQYELSSQWVGDLMAAGRSKMDIIDPYSPARAVTDVYGYQLLGPLLRNNSFDSGFLSTVGGDIVDFEMQQGKDGALWTEARGENIRLDWTVSHDDNKAPAGYDPVNSLMDALSRNGEATRDLLTGVTHFTADGPEGGRLPRLDYLLTDRDWNATQDVPGGPGWAAELMANGEDYKNGSLDSFGIALERAATDTPGPDARRLVEAIIYETSADEQARGYANREDPTGDAQTVEFSKNNLIHPELRDSMGNIVSAYIADVNHNIADSRTVTDETLNVNRTDLTRFLADIGKDEGAHQTVANAEAVYAAAKYDEILSGRQNPNDDINGNLRSMEVVSRNYGSVLGAIDFGATEAQHATSADLDKQHNDGIEDRYKVIGPLVEGTIGAATAKVPGLSDLANGFAGNIMEDLEKDAKIDNTGRVAYDVGATLGAGHTTTVDLTEVALYNSGKLEGLPAGLIQDGQPKPVSEWTDKDHDEWQIYKGGQGQSTLGSAAVHAGESYQSGYDWTRDTLGEWKSEVSK